MVDLKLKTLTPTPPHPHPHPHTQGDFCQFFLPRTKNQRLKVEKTEQFLPPFWLIDWIWIYEPKGNDKNILLHYSLIFEWRILGLQCTYHFDHILLFWAFLYLFIIIYFLEFRWLVFHKHLFNFKLIKLILKSFILNFIK